MKKHFLLALLLIITVATRSQSFRITGKISGRPAGILKLHYSDKEGRRVVDSSIIRNGRFDFHGFLSEPTMAYLDGAVRSASMDDPNTTAFFIEPADMTISVVCNRFKDAIITGSSSQEENRELERKKAPVYQRERPLEREYRLAGNAYSEAVKAKKSEAEIDTLKYKAAAIHNRFDPFNQEVAAIDYTFFAGHPQSYVTAFMLRFHVSDLSLDSLQMFYDHLGAEVQQSRSGKEIAAEIQQLKAGSPGSQADNFTTTDIDGNKLSLSDYKGKYVLIDFWASWCVPCRESMPHVKELYAQYKDRGLTVIGVADDDHHETDWKKAIEKDGTGIWRNVLRGLDMEKITRHEPNPNDISELFGVHSLPTKILLDGNGMIIARYDKGTEAEAKAMDDQLKILFDQDLSAGNAADTITLATLRAAVEASPDSFSAHVRFIESFVKGVPGTNFENKDSVLSLLQPQYAAWMERFPHSATVPLGFGDAYAGAESPKAREYLLRAVALDPKMAKAWEDLAGDAELWGDTETERKYWKKAMDADTGNVDYAFQYAFTFRDSDPEKYRQMSLGVATHFPNSERGAQAFYWLANQTKDPKARVALYEQSRKAFPPEIFDWSAGSMSEYFDLLLELDPEKALYLARSMVAAKVGGIGETEWHSQVILARQFAAGRQLLGNNKPGAALQVLDSVHLSRWSGAHDVLRQLKAQALDNLGNTRAAYDTLLFYYAKAPSDQIREALSRYAAKLGKDKYQVDAEIRKLREKWIRSAPPFKLAAYLTNDSVSLEDYRGRVLLLTFWFPGCGPCRDEFRYFQAALKTFDPKDIAFVGININPNQDAYVIPFMKSSGFGFIPLRDSGSRTQKAYHVAAAPTSFLIDRQGRIVFPDLYVRSHKARRMLELMIGSLLEEKP